MCRTFFAIAGCEELLAQTACLLVIAGGCGPESLSSWHNREMLAIMIKAIRALESASQADLEISQRKLEIPSVNTQTFKDADLQSIRIDEAGTTRPRNCNGLLKRHLVL